MKQEASSSATEGSACYCALIHHCQLNLLCPAAAINLLLHTSIPKPTDTTHNTVEGGLLHKAGTPTAVSISSGGRSRACKARRGGLPILGLTPYDQLLITLYVTKSSTYKSYSVLEITTHSNFYHLMTIDLRVNELFTQ